MISTSLPRMKTTLFEQDALEETVEAPVKTNNVTLQ